MRRQPREIKRIGRIVVNTKTGETIRKAGRRPQGSPPIHIIRPRLYYDYERFCQATVLPGGLSRMNSRIQCLLYGCGIRDMIRAFIREKGEEIWPSTRMVRNRRDFIAASRYACQNMIIPGHGLIL